MDNNNILICGYYDVESVKLSKHNCKCKSMHSHPCPILYTEWFSFQILVFRIFKIYRRKINNNTKKNNIIIKKKK